ncbi:unnamed protein product [Arctia plantaginis]|uniref:Uncharacterized protein n=1 Tax=Arctia plantaginis TaxID=874455 RepID=A0A8S1BBY0_ARCPL|nr:unnamed protein product [Arctia plantaginis]
MAQKTKGILGDLVLLHEENLALFVAFGTITRLFPGPVGCRFADANNQRKLRRSFTRLGPLPLLNIC